MAPAQGRARPAQGPRKGNKARVRSQKGPKIEGGHKAPAQGPRKDHKKPAQGTRARTAQGPRKEWTKLLFR